jgi:hypothetical protein
MRSVRPQLTIPRALATIAMRAKNSQGGVFLPLERSGAPPAFSPTDTLLRTINPATGASSVVGNMGFASGGDLAFNAGNFYLASTLSQLVQVNPSTGAGTLVGSFGVPSVFGLATGDDGGLYAVANRNVYTVDTATGAATFLSTFNNLALGSAFGQSFFTESGAPDPDPDPTPVPEPASLILLVTALGTGGLVRRRKSNQTRLPRE